MWNDTQYQRTNILTAATTVIFTGSGTLGSVIVNGTGAGGTVTLIDTTSPNVNIGIVTTGSAIAIPYNCAIAGGLTVTTSAASNITVTWTK